MTKRPRTKIGEESTVPGRATVLRCSLAGSLMPIDAFVAFGREGLRPNIGQSLACAAGAPAVAARMASTRARITRVAVPRRGWCHAARRPAHARPMSPALPRCPEDRLDPARSGRAELLAP